jgi:ubiquitin-conjugating enzyme E2 D/E
MTALDRITREYKDLIRNPIANCGVTIGYFDDSNPNPMKWRITLTGPKDSPYKGGLFYLSADFPQSYPQDPPEVCFITPIYHVNINPNASNYQGGESLGHVCISTLNWWKPEYTMREVLTNIFALFYLGNPDSPYGLDRAAEFRKNRATYDEKARKFTRKYAHPLIGFKEYPKNQNWNFS